MPAKKALKKAKKKGSAKSSSEKVFMAPRQLPSTVKVTPSYLFDSNSQNAIGGQHNPYVWNVTVPGYAIVSIIFGLKGRPGKNYNIQVRHSFPLGIYTIETKTGTLPPGGIAEVEFAGLRPRRPEINIIGFSTGDDTDFDTIGATLYATIA
jgi:hypothetical protein